MDVVGAHEFQSFSVYGGAATHGFSRRYDGSLSTHDNLFQFIGTGHWGGEYRR